MIRILQKEHKKSSPKTYKTPFVPWGMETHLIIRKEKAGQQVRGLSWKEKRPRSSTSMRCSGSYGRGIPRIIMKRDKKHILAMLIAMLMVMLILPASAAASEVPAEKEQASVIEYTVQEAVEAGQYGWCETPYGTVYIMEDGSLAKGEARISYEIDTGTIKDGQLEKEVVTNDFYFDPETGLMKTNVFINWCYYNEKGHKDFKLAPIIGGICFFIITVLLAIVYYHNTYDGYNTRMILVCGLFVVLMLFTLI